MKGKIKIRNAKKKTVNENFEKNGNKNVNSCRIMN